VIRPKLSLGGKREQEGGKLILPGPLPMRHTIAWRDESIEKETNPIGEDSVIGQIDLLGRD